METQRNADDGISAESVNEKQNREDREKKNCPPAFAAAETQESQDPYGRFSSLMPTR